MPRWGQLGCQGFIILDSSGNVACETTPPFMEVQQLAFMYVEMALRSLLAKQPIPAVGPGVVVRVGASAQHPHLKGGLGMCISCENSDGKCHVTFGGGRTAWIDRAHLTTEEEEKQMDESDCCGQGGFNEAEYSGKKRCESCENGPPQPVANSSSERLKEAIATELEACADAVRMACRAVAEGSNLQAAALQKLQKQMLVAKGEFKEILADAKRELEGDSRLTTFTLNGPCSNDLCLCAVCECGVSCRCNVADVKDEETCEKCVDFRAKKKAAAAAGGASC